MTYNPFDSLVKASTDDCDRLIGLLMEEIDRPGTYSLQRQGDIVFSWKFDSSGKITDLKSDRVTPSPRKSKKSYTEDNAGCWDPSDAFEGWAD